MDSGATLYDQIVRLATENQQLVIGLGVAVLVVVFTRLAVSPGGRVKSKGVLTEDYKPYPLISRRAVSHNSFVFRFGLPSETSRLGLPLGRHISLRAFIDGEETRRPYTPISSDATQGYFDLLIKVYPEPNGKMSRHINALKLGETIDVRGPLGKFVYNKNAYPQICMVCGGTGITPMWQVLRELLSDEDDRSNIKLVFANVTEADILLRKELDELAVSNPRFSVYYVLNNPLPGWTGGVGFVTQEILRNQFGEPAPTKLVLMCGPPPMNKAMKEHLSSLNFSEDQIFKF